LEGSEWDRKNLQKVSPKKVLLQHFNNICVLAKEGRVSKIEKPDGLRIKTGQLRLEIIDYQFDY
jgi:hypothetical protein